MKSALDNNTYDLEKEYLQVKVTLYKNLFKYCLIIAFIIAATEITSGFLAAPERFIMIILVIGFVIFLSYFIWRLKNNQELIITIFLTFFFSSSLLADCYTPADYFKKPVDAFGLAYNYASFERIVLSRISKFSHRVWFVAFNFMLRFMTVRAENYWISIMQFTYVLITIYLDMDKEKYDRALFSTYYRNKEQLVKFKNLVVQDIPEGIVIIAQNLTSPLFVNNSFKKLVGDNSSLSIPSKLKQFIVQENQNEKSFVSTSKRQTLLAFLESTIHQQNAYSRTQKYSCYVTFRKSDQSTAKNEDHQDEDYVFETNAIHLIWNDQPAIAIVLHDITQQHTILNLKMADAQKDAILATVSHELRTPLNGILGMVQVMLKKVRDSEMTSYLNICKNSGDLLLSLVNSILDLNQINAKKLKLNIERINLRETLENIGSLFEFQCRQKGLYLKLDISSSCHKHLTTDRNRLSQILINLIGNALKFTRNGGIIIAASRAQNPKYIGFKVEDTGIGIKDEDKRKLFHTFGKLQQSDKDINPHGVGLGLTISDKLARLLKGSTKDEGGIKLESCYGLGSRFSFSIREILEDNYEEDELEDSLVESDLSRKVTDERGGVHARMQNYTKKFTRSSERLMNTSFLSVMTPYVLIVDDNPFNVTIAECLVSSHGYKTKTALYSQTAIDLVLKCDYSQEPIKLILMDCQMPEIDGFMTSKILNKMMADKRIPMIPVVALTANDSERDREASKKAGMCEHITKPLKEPELARILNKYMAR